MKRLTETQKWQDAWFMDLPAKWKLAWYWILDNCDHAGIVEANPRLMSFVIGEPIDGDEFIRVMSGRVTKPKSGKWFVNHFIAFQYGDTLNPQNSAHKGVLRKLAEAGIDCPVKVLDSPSIAPVKGLQSPCQGAQDKDKDKDKDKEQVIDAPSSRFTPPSENQVAEYAQSIGFTLLDASSFCDFYASKGWVVGKSKMKDWRAAVRTWKKTSLPQPALFNSPPHTHSPKIRVPDNLRPGYTR